MKVQSEHDTRSALRAKEIKLSGMANAAAGHTNDASRRRCTYVAVVVVLSRTFSRSPRSSYRFYTFASN